MAETLVWFIGGNSNGRFEITNDELSPIVGIIPDRYLLHRNAFGDTPEMCVYFESSMSDEEKEEALKKLKSQVKGEIGSCV